MVLPSIFAKNGGLYWSLFYRSMCYIMKVRVSVGKKLGSNVMIDVSGRMKVEVDAVQHPSYTT